MGDAAPCSSMSAMVMFHQATCRPSRLYIPTRDRVPLESSPTRAEIWRNSHDSESFGSIEFAVELVSDGLSAFRAGISKDCKILNSGRHVRS
jgi:hypothetical protein